MFLASRQFDLAVAQIPKAGISSIRDWLRPGFEMVSIDEARKYGTRVAFIRHPLARTKSAYQFFYWVKWRGSKKYDQIPTDSWHSFVDEVVGPNQDNTHWMPQVVFTGDAPNVWHKFENIGTHWHKYYPTILCHMNASAPLETDDYRKDDLLEKYADDLLLWSSAT